MSDTTPGCAARYATTGAFGHTQAQLVHARWGAGADAGKYHVYLVGANLWPLGAGFSLQCVVDDFGTLVNPDHGRPQ